MHTLIPVAALANYSTSTHACVCGCVSSCRSVRALRSCHLHLSEQRSATIQSTPSSTLSTTSWMSILKSLVLSFIVVVSVIVEHLILPHGSAARLHRALVLMCAVVFFISILPLVLRLLCLLIPSMPWHSRTTPATHSTHATHACMKLYVDLYFYFYPSHFSVFVWYS